MTFTELSKSYLDSGCRRKDGMPRPAHQQAQERIRIGFLRPFFRRIPIDNIGLKTCADYGIENAERPRAVDLDLQTLSNMLTFAVLEGYLKVNPIIGRAKHRKAGDIRHSRECMPASGDVIHALARRMMASSPSAAWQLLVEAHTGCRTSETLALRMDGKQRGDPGFIEGEYLYIRRAKKGVNPFIRIEPELREVIEAHHAWHRANHSASPWWFPGASIFLPLSRRTLTQRLAMDCAAMGIPHITSHGLRAFFVTLQRSRGMSNEQVASLIGDKTSGLIESVYGNLPSVWSGGEPLSFTPKDGLRAWDAKLSVVA